MSAKYKNGSSVSINDLILFQTVDDTVSVGTLISDNGDGTGTAQITDANGNVHSEGVIFDLSYKVGDLFPDL